MREFINPKEIGNIIIKKTIGEYSVPCSLNKSPTIFVFPTNMAKKTWIQWLINPKSGCNQNIKAIESDKFIEWKEFKEKYLFSPEKGRKPASPELRQIFAYNYINNNKSKISSILKYTNFKNKKLEKISDPFSSWLGNNIGELHYWKKKTENQYINYGKFDKEDNEYNELYESYKDFLNKNNLYEQDWIDFSLDSTSKDPFNYIKLNDNTKHFIIFFPEIIDDFEDYKSYLENHENITLYYIDKKICNQEKAPISIHFPDSRTELRITMLRIIDTVSSGKADWSEIGLTVPDIETYKPYIKREFDLYNIPYVFKQGESIVNNKFGRIFQEIYDCYYSYFSFKSVSTLLLDNFINWKDSISPIIDKLISEGKRMRCLCSYEQDENNKTDIWQKSLTQKIKNTTDNNIKSQYIELLNFYNEFKEIIISFFPEDPAKTSFSNIKFCWNNFLQKYTTISVSNSSKTDQTENEIISEVCMEILNNLIQIEKKYENNSYKFNIKSPFEFYLQQLQKKLFISNSKNSKGVQIMMYTHSAAANFKYQFIIDSSQKNLSYENKRLTFLNSLKREKLRLSDSSSPYPEIDENIIKQAEAFIYLYNKSDCYFSSAQKTFNGYQIPYYILNSKDITPEAVKKLEKKEDKTDFNKLNKWFKEWNDKDYIISEKNYILNNLETKSANIKLSKKQIESFNKWKTASENSPLKENITSEYKEKLENRINSILTKQNKTGNNDFCISPRGSLENYFPCPRVWLFKKFFNLPISNETVTLFNNFDMGNYHHKIMEHFMDFYKNNNKTIPCYTDNMFSRTVNDTTEDCTEEILTNLDNAIEKTYTTLDDDFKDSILTIESLKAQKNKDKKDIIFFLQHFLLNYKGKKSNSVTGVGNCTVYDTEKYCIKPFKMDNLCWNYNGSIDSIFKTPENKLIIVDYKNSSYSIPEAKDFKATKDHILKDFQMAIYYYMINENNNIYKMQYYSFYPNSNNVFHKNYTISDENIETLHEYSELFVKSAKTGDLSSFNPYPSEEFDNNKFSIDKDICNKCSFKKICRTTFSIGKNEITK